MRQSRSTTPPCGTAPRRRISAFSGRGQDPHRQKAGRFGGRLHRRRLARLQPQGSGFLQGDPPIRRPQRQPASPPSAAPTTPRTGRRRRTPTSRPCCSARRRWSPSSARPGTFTSRDALRHHPGPRTWNSSPTPWPTSSPGSQELFYDAEHFFDGFKANRTTPCDALKAARRAGPTAWSCATPTAGPCPHELLEIIEAVQRAPQRHPPGHPRPQRLGTGRGQLAGRGGTGHASRCRGPSTASASAAATPTSAPSSRPCSSRWGSTASPTSSSAG